MEFIVFVIFICLLFVVIYFTTGGGDRNTPVIFSHWYHLIENLQESSKDFYTLVETSIAERQLPDTKTSRIDYREGGVFSAKREYLRVNRKEHVFDICAAPFGKGFFISWWLGQTTSTFLSLILNIPFLGPALVRTFRPETYYRLDTALMFQESVHAAVLEVLDQKTKTEGLRSLSELERKPILSDLFKR